MEKRSLHSAFLVALLACMVICASLSLEGCSTIGGGEKEWRNSLGQDIGKSESYFDPSGPAPYPYPDYSRKDDKKDYSSIGRSW